MYSKAPPTTTAATGPGDDDVELSGVRDGPYEVMDLDKARERVREKKKQQKRNRVQSTSLPEPTAAEVSGCWSHHVTLFVCYSTPHPVYETTCEHFPL